MARQFTSKGRIKEGVHPPGVPNYLVQTEQQRQWTAAEFMRGRNIIGVRYAGVAEVYLPHDLEIEKTVSVKDENGDGVVVSIY